MSGDQDPDKDPDGSVDAEDDHVDDDPDFLHVAGDHVSPHTEDDRDGVDRDGQEQLPDPGISLLQTYCHSLEETVD